MSSIPERPITASVLTSLPIALKKIGAAEKRAARAVHILETTCDWLPAPNKIELLAAGKQDVPNQATKILPHGIKLIWLRDDDGAEVKVAIYEIYTSGPCSLVIYRPGAGTESFTWVPETEGDTAREPVEVMGVAIEQIRYPGIRGMATRLRKKLMGPDGVT